MGARVGFILARCAGRDGVDWLGATGLARPGTAAEAHGLPLQDPRDFRFVRVKAASDLRARHIPRAIEPATNLANEDIKDLRGRIVDLRATLRRALLEYTENTSS